MSTHLADVIAVLERAYPLELAAAWDTGIGLTCGDPTDAVSTVLLAVDADPATVREAATVGAELLLTHHPLLFRPVQSVAADTPRGGLVHRLGRARIAHYAAHTNADTAAGGVNDALAAALGLREVAPLPDGPGRTGRLPEPLSAGDFAGRVAAALPATVTGARLAGDPERAVSRVAVCGGAGGSLLPAVAAAGVDAFVTADLSHHVAAEFAADPASPVLVDVAHWASEWPWLARAAALLTTELGVTTIVSTLRTDPWSLRVG